MTPRRDPRAYVGDILEAIANIEADTDGLDFNQFAADRRVRQLVERNIEIISGANRRRPDETKEAVLVWIDDHRHRADSPATAQRSAFGRDFHRGDYAVCREEGTPAGKAFKALRAHCRTKGKARIVFHL